MASSITINYAPVPSVAPQSTEPESPVNSIAPLSSSSATVSVNLGMQAPFAVIQKLFDHLHAAPDEAAELNAVYQRGGIVKKAAMSNALSDQKFTIDLSPSRNARIPGFLLTSLAAHGFDEVQDFFHTLRTAYVPLVLSSLSVLAGVDLGAAHQNSNMNFRLCDYHPDTAGPNSSNGCGAHTDYGTFSIIFQDGTAGLELEDADGGWRSVPGDVTVILTGWCALLLSGGRIRAARHRVRRVPGVRRLSAVLFMAPDVDVKLAPLAGIVPVDTFSDRIMQGEMDVEYFKEVMGKRWRYREGNEDMGEQEGSGAKTQDDDIERMIWG